jgi:hypothetical protein
MAWRINAQLLLLEVLFATPVLEEDLLLARFHMSPATRLLPVLPAPTWLALLKKMMMDQSPMLV